MARKGLREENNPPCRGRYLDDVFKGRRGSSRRKHNELIRDSGKEHGVKIFADIICSVTPSPGE